MSMIQRHPKAALNYIQSHLDASVSNTAPLKMAQYTTLMAFLRKIEILECEADEN